MSANDYIPPADESLNLGSPYDFEEANGAITWNSVSAHSAFLA